MNKPRWGLEAWYTAHLCYGIIQLVFIPILIPTFILDKTGSPTQVGIAMGILGLSGLLAPVLGGLADRYRAHRAAQLIGLAAIAIAALVFGLSGANFMLHLLAAVFLGLGSASLLMINPAFIVSGGYEAEEEASKLTLLNQVAIVGSLLAGIGLAALTEAGVSFELRFAVMFFIPLLALLVTAATNKQAAARIKVEQVNEGSEAGGIMQVVFSRFGLILLAIFFVSIGQGVITGQFPNYMAEVFKVDAALSSMALSVSAVVSLVLLFLVGKAMAKVGGERVWLLAVVAKVVVMLGLAGLALYAGQLAAYLPLGLYLVYLQGVTAVDMVQPAIAAKASRAGAGMTQGLLMFAIAGAYAGGNVLSGISADSFGWSSLASIVAAVSAIALVVGLTCLVSKPKVAIQRATFNDSESTSKL
ncbi:MFS transporter [Agarivorans sp. B2Z047]|uniref:MFS transporter n=1 Tax=Agarivorans sp. B2Z047 TaxID=2652721 RepID=UPI00128E45C5|nr:MFS transporter [Agarivorans sp. B2Z047]MPW28501.1 MFS transporter [Agarivorans sp. B2Z047]UQN41063.1 MFS transporter [Agarivorans sp. B2Z047]